MAAPDLVNLSGLLDEPRASPSCASSAAVIRDGCDDTQPCRQRSRGKARASRLDDLTATVLAGRRQPLRVWVWVACLCAMGLSASGVQAMTEQPRHRGIAQEKLPPYLGLFRVVHNARPRGVTQTTTPEPTRSQRFLPATFTTTSPICRS